jgi:hypothetical protein
MVGSLGEDAGCGDEGFSFDIRETLDLRGSRPFTLQTPIGGLLGMTVTGRISRVRGVPNSWYPRRPPADRRSGHRVSSERP